MEVANKLLLATQDEATLNSIPGSLILTSKYKMLTYDTGV